MPIHSIELFTGAGGLALGLEKAGCHHAAMFEFNTQACNTIRHNISTGQKLAKNWTIYEKDVRGINYSEFVNSIEMVAGGPPVNHSHLEEKREVEMIRETTILSSKLENVYTLCIINLFAL